ncbi:MAG: hypothetical protein JNM57_13535 [Cyclobacteriaceae bacterium]|nr:hypothetical protein [Cyclobacteriaceae bacterium]
MLIKKIALTLYLIMLVSILTTAQDMRDIFDRKTSITWLGLDFTGAKFIGDREKFGSESDIRNTMEAWNNLLIKEADKYDIAAAIQKVKVENAIQVTIDNNAQLDLSEIFSENSKDHLRLKPEHIAEIISSYDYQGKSGIGLMFNVETFSKTNGEGVVWVTFINMDSREVFFTERLTAPPGGFGIRNYWAGCIKSILEKMTKKEFEMWRKKYYRP